MGGEGGGGCMSSVFVAHTSLCVHANMAHYVHFIDAHRSCTSLPHSVCVRL